MTQTESDIGFVYNWKNSINGKFYLGSHKGTPDDGYIGSGKYFKRALKKYGIENFERRILYVGTKYIKIEEGYLVILDCSSNKNYYNLKNKALGGGKPSADTKRKISKALKGKKRQPHSADTRLKMSASRMGENNPRYGKPVTDEHKARISASRKGKSVGEENPAKREDVRKKMSENRKGKGMGDDNPMRRPEVRKKFMGKNNPNYGKELPKIACPHCDMKAAAHVIYRFHFDNCKKKIA